MALTSLNKRTYDLRGSHIYMHTESTLDDPKTFWLTFQLLAQVVEQIALSLASEHAILVPTAGDSQ